ncbi:MAG: hypothetical protein WDW36_006530 [Sanguina aurantia]
MTYVSSTRAVLVHDSYIVLTRPVVKRPELWSPEAGMPPPLQGSSSETKAPGLKATPSLDLEPTPAPAPPSPASHSKSNAASSFEGPPLALPQ